MNIIREAFADRLAKGQKGEVSAISLLEQITEVRDMTGYEEFKAYQEKGFDIEFLNRKTGAWDRADIKSNVTKQGFGFLETVAENGKLGWFYTTKADCILLHSRHTDQLYYFNVTEMRNYIKRRVEELKTLQIRTVGNGGKGVWLPVEKNHLISEITLPQK